MNWRRLQLILGVGVLAVCVAMTAMGLPRVLAAVRHEQSQRGHAVQQLAALAAAGFETKASDRAAEELRAAMSRFPAVSAVRVTDPDGLVVVSTGLSERIAQLLAEGSPLVQKASLIRAGRICGEVQVLFRPTTHTSVFHPSSPRFWAVVLLSVVVLPAVVAGLEIVRRRYDRSPHGPLAAAATRARHTLDTLAEGVLLIDARGLIIFANRAFQEALGSAVDVAGRPIAALEWAPSQDQSIGRFPWECTLSDATAVRGVKVGMSQGTHSRTFSVNSTPLKTRRGVLEAVLVTLDDVTELEQGRLALKEARDAAEHANQAKSQFLAMMSHEIRTPLNGVNGTLQLLARSSLDSRQAHYVSAARFSASTLLHLINDILDFSKIEAGQLELSPVEFDLEACVDETFLMLAQSAASKGLVIAYEIEDEVARTFHADPDRIRQIIINLVNNAIKFTARGSVVLSASARPAHEGRQLLRCSVTDTGIGIPEDRLHRLFKAFSQVDSSTSRRYGGTGLGLVISKQLCGLMGGDITVTSAAGQGTTFTFTLNLPLGNPTDEAGVPPASPSALVLVGLHDFERRNCIRSLAVPEDRVEVFGSVGDLVEHWRRTSSGPPEGAFVLVGGATAAGVLASATELAADPRSRSARFVGAVYDQDTPSPGESRSISGWIRRPIGRNRLLAMWNQDGEPSKPREPSAPGGSLQGVRVLLAEDNAVGQMVVNDMLVGAGASCDAVSDGHQVIAALRRARYDVVLMDCFMPELDGFETTRRVRHMEKSGELSGQQVIIALTAKAMRGDREACLQAGMDGYVSKPVDEGDLLRTIACHLKISNGSRTPNAAPAAPVTDTPLLLRQFGHKPEMLRKLIAAFRDAAGEDLARIDKALRTDDPALLEQAAHRLAGGAGFVCATRVRATAAALEARCAQDQLEALAAQAAELRSHVEEALRDLDALARSRPGESTATSPETPS